METAPRTTPVPDVLVLPTMTDVPRDADGVPLLDETVDLMLLPLSARPGEDRLTALAFSTVDGLVAAMGEDQPWVAVPGTALAGALRGSGAEAVLLDPRPGPDGLPAPRGGGEAGAPAYGGPVEAGAQVGGGRGEAGAPAGGGRGEAGA
ncbi:SAV_915 family protein [Streptomyces adustus]|uniref:SAV_915 family protein n=1 Tax=Streptomyces adustus TaxID=1609272 RepID=UPI0037227CE8